VAEQLIISCGLNWWNALFRHFCLRENGHQLSPCFWPSKQDFAITHGYPKQV